MNIISSEESVKTYSNTNEYKLNKTKGSEIFLNNVDSDIIVREDKSQCTVFTFNTGSFYDVVLENVLLLKSGIDGIQIGDETFTTESDDRYDLSDNNVETVIRFKSESKHITVNVYKTTFKLMINGKGFKWFVDGFFEKFLHSQINEKRIAKINENIKDTIKSKNTSENPNTEEGKVTYNEVETNTNDILQLEEHPEEFQCDQCEKTFLIGDKLREHIAEEHRQDIHIGSSQCEKTFVESETLPEHPSETHRS